MPSRKRIPSGAWPGETKTRPGLAAADAHQGPAVIDHHDPGLRPGPGRGQPLVVAAQVAGPVDVTARESQPPQAGRAGAERRRRRAHEPAVSSAAAAASSSHK